MSMLPVSVVLPNVMTCLLCSRSRVPIFYPLLGPKTVITSTSCRFPFVT